MIKIKVEMELILGGVYRTSLYQEEFLKVKPTFLPVPKPILTRVIMFNDKLVYYDTWWEHKDDWGYRSQLQSKFIFYTAATNHFLSDSEFLRTEPLSEKECKVYRPDLPFHIFSDLCLRFTDKPFADIKGYQKYIENQAVNTSSLQSLNINELIIIPVGEKGAHKKSVYIKALNKLNFSGIELLWHTHNIQAPYVKSEPETGLGLHRLGIEKGIPSFYIVGSHDSTGFCSESE